jgi:hypothetical protein
MILSLCGENRACRGPNAPQRLDRGRKSLRDASRLKQIEKNVFNVKWKFKADILGDLFVGKTFLSLIRGNLDLGERQIHRRPIKSTPKSHSHMRSDYFVGWYMRDSGRGNFQAEGGGRATVLASL